MKKTLNIPTTNTIGIAKVPYAGTVGLLEETKISIDIIAEQDFDFSRKIVFLESELPSNVIGAKSLDGDMLSEIGATEVNEKFFVKKDVLGRQVEVICPDRKSFAYVVPQTWIS